MVSAPQACDAVKRARALPRLRVGLHVVLVEGRPTLPASAVPDLVDASGNFRADMAASAANMFFRPKVRRQLEAEIAAQFDAFRATGLPLDHVNGHLHFHLHPAIFKILMEDADSPGIRHMRLTRDCLSRSRKISHGHWFYRVSHAAIFEFLSSRARKPLEQKKIRHVQITFGLLQNARVDEEYVLKLLDVLPSGDSELYSHPSLDEFKNEFDALVSPRVKEKIKSLGIELIRYQDL